MCIQGHLGTFAIMAQVVLAVDVVTGLVGLGATANAPTVGPQATMTTAASTPGMPMSYNFINATCYGSGKFTYVYMHRPCHPASLLVCHPPSLSTRHGARQTLPAKALPSKLHACDGRLKAVDTTAVAETSRRQLQHHVHHRLGMLCRGDGYFEGPGNYTMDYGTFDGYGLINGSSGSYTGENIVKSDCSHLPYNL